MDENTWPVDAGIFAPWRLRDEGPAPLGWYFKRPDDNAQAGPFATRAEAKAQARKERKAWLVYATNGNGDRLIYRGGPFEIYDRLDSIEWTAGAVEETERFVCLRNGAPALPDDRHFTDDLRLAFAILDEASKEAAA